MILCIIGHWASRQKFSFCIIHISASNLIAPRLTAKANLHIEMLLFHLALLPIWLFTWQLALLHSARPCLRIFAIRGDLVQWAKVCRKNYFAFRRRVGVELHGNCHAFSGLLICMAICVLISYRSHAVSSLCERYCQVISITCRILIAIC